MRERQPSWRPPEQAVPAPQEDGVDPLNVAKTKTLVHEVAHYVADHAPNLPKGDVETVAESSAFVVMDRFGLDTGAYSFPYVAGWARNADVLRRNLAEIQRVSHRLVVAVEGVGDPYADGVGSADRLDRGTVPMQHSGGEDAGGEGTPDG